MERKASFKGGWWLGTEEDSSQASYSKKKGRDRMGREDVELRGRVGDTLLLVSNLAAGIWEQNREAILSELLRFRDLQPAKINCSKMTGEMS